MSLCSGLDICLSESLGLSLLIMSLLMLLQNARSDTAWKLFHESEVGKQVERSR